jgi:predicted metalloprotease
MKWLCAVVTLTFALVACGHDKEGPGNGSSSGGDAGSGDSTTEQPTDTQSAQTMEEWRQIVKRLRDRRNNVPVAEPDSAVLTSPSSGGTQEGAARNYVVAVLEDADKMWSDWFGRMGLEEPNVSYETIMPGLTSSSRCKLGVKLDSHYQNAFFCRADAVAPADGKIFLPMTTFLDMWSGNIFNKRSKSAGDFAAATIVAHEFGHHIANELAIQGAFQLPDARMNRELEADCFSGVWARSLYGEGKLEDGDIQEAMDAIFAIGDYDLNNPDHHGTPAQRVNAWSVGYYGLKSNATPALPYNCMSAFGGARPGAGPQS